MRWLFRALGALLILLLIAVGLVFLIPAERIAATAAQQFERLTGRHLQIDGDVSPRFWPVLGVSTGPVTIANADWSDAGPMFRAESLSIEINASALLGGEVRILGIRATRPQIVLERARDGRENWVFGGGGSGGEVSTTTPGVGRAYTLDEALMTGGTIRFVDHGTGQDVTLDTVDASLKIPDFSGPAQLAVSAVMAGQKVSLTAEAGVFSAFTEGRVVPLYIQARIGGADISFAGRGGFGPVTASGYLQADLSDLAALAALAGAAAPDLPQGLGAVSLSVTADLTLDSAGALYLRGAVIRADGNELTGDIDLKPGKDRPKLSARLRTDALSLAGLSGGQGGGAGGGMEAASWPKDKIDVSGLAAVDAAVLAEAVAPAAHAGFPIVGIGASAGGLAAFESFFSAMPDGHGGGMAFVLVQHLAPDHKSLLSELVGRYTRMPVYEVAHGMVVEPDCAYIIPPNYDMAFLNGTLQLLLPGAPRGHRCPIDFFFKSLAQDQHARAIGIVLSGTGSDGTQGVRAIKAEGGMVMAQSTESTQYLSLIHI